MNESDSVVPGDTEPDSTLADTNDSVVITEVHDPNAPSWTRKRAVWTGVFVGAFFGVIFFAGYAATSAWICSARLDCGHWAPIAIVSSSGAAGMAVLGGFGGYVLHKMYRLFKVA